VTGFDVGNKTGIESEPFQSEAVLAGVVESVRYPIHIPNPRDSGTRGIRILLSNDISSSFRMAKGPVSDSILGCVRVSIIYNTDQSSRVRGHSERQLSIAQW
jgi:hypothetical protein